MSIYRYMSRVQLQTVCTENQAAAGNREDPTDKSEATLDIPPASPAGGKWILFKMQCSAVGHRTFVYINV